MMDWILSSCVLILAVLLFGKLLGGRVSSRLRYGLWFLVLIRLLVPVQLYDLPGEVKTARISPVMEEKSIYVFPMNSAPVEDAGSINAHVLPDGTVTIATSMGYGRLENNGQKVVVYMDKLSPMEFFALVWKVGAMLFAVVIFGSNLRFALGLRKRRRPFSADSPLPVYVVGGLSSSCLFGLLIPAIYLTEEVAEQKSALRHVITHEITHYRHFDHLWSALRCAALAVHWWNPLVWLAVFKSKQDGELACDEGTLEKLGESERRAYGDTLLHLVTVKTTPRDVLHCATTMTGSKKALYARITRIARRPETQPFAAAVLVLMVILAGTVSFGRVAEASSETTGQVVVHGVVSADTEKIMRLIFSTDRSDLYYPIFPLADSDSTEEEKLAALEATRSVTEAWETEIGEFLCDDSERWIHYWNNNLFIRYTQRQGIEYELLELWFVSGTDSIEKVDAIYRMDGIEYTTRFRFERDESGKVERFIYENAPPCPATGAE